MVNHNEVKEEKYAKGEIIFREGDKDFHFYILQQGKVQIFSTTPEGRKVAIAVIEEGEAFGEFSLLDSAPRSASAMAMTECVIMKISADAYEKLLQDLPDWASNMLRSLVNRLKSMNEKLKALGK
jgi:CRP/FNR family transcriptional regulator, cyclic AMP receptor protein